MGLEPSALGYAMSDHNRSKWDDLHCKRLALHPTFSSSWTINYSC